MEGWVPLFESTPSGNIPRNCRVRVNLLVAPSSASAAAVSTASPEEQEGRKNESVATDSETAATDYETVKTGSETVVTDSETVATGSETVATDFDSAADPRQKEAGGVMLALPWRRFDRDLEMAGGGEGGEGLKVCGRRLAVGDVSNSDEGTGLFTWDGAVLLAKYLEHQHAAMIRDIRDRQSGRHNTTTNTNTTNNTNTNTTTDTTTSPPTNTNITNTNTNTNTNTTTDTTTSRPTNTNATTTTTTTTTNSPQPIRVLELGCGTGLAGLAAALSLGQQPNHPNNFKTLPTPSQDPNQKRLAQRGTPSSPPLLPTAGVEVVMTDLPYALTNARSNIARNASVLQAAGARVVATELDWCRSLPTGLRG
ncbi:unnamed protein product [Laminaria digitata]